MAQWLIGSDQIKVKTKYNSTSCCVTVIAEVKPFCCEYSVFIVTQRFFCETDSHSESGPVTSHQNWRWKQFFTSRGCDSVAPTTLTSWMKVWRCCCCFMSPWKFFPEFISTVVSDSPPPPPSHPPTFTFTPQQFVYGTRLRHSRGRRRRRRRRGEEGEENIAPYLSQDHRGSF